MTEFYRKKKTKKIIDRILQEKKLRRQLTEFYRGKTKQIIDRILQEKKTKKIMDRILQEKTKKTIERIGKKPDDFFIFCQWRFS